MKKTFRFAIGICALTSSVNALADIQGTWNLGDVQTMSQSFDGRRCANASVAECTAANKFALDYKAIDQAAHDWLEANGFFVTPMNYGKGGSICKCGCFSSFTNILMIEGNSFKYKKADNVKAGDKIAALAEDSYLHNPEVVKREVLLTTKGKERTPLFVFKLENGVKLKVTKDHGMVLDTGEIVAAKDVKMADRFVTVDGTAVAIETIGREFTNKNVVNFEVNSKNLENHVVVAEGIFIGDLGWQNQYKSLLNAVQLRK
jgi:hypothetical protein